MECSPVRKNQSEVLLKSKLRRISWLTGWVKAAKTTLLRQDSTIAYYILCVKKNMSQYLCLDHENDLSESYDFET
jgi:O-succinylbenzoate synthase